MNRNEKKVSVIMLVTAITTILVFVYIITYSNSPNVDVNSNNQIENRTIANSEIVNIENNYQGNFSDEEIEKAKIDIDKKIDMNLNNEIKKTKGLDWEEAYVYIIRSYKLKFAGENDCSFALYDLDNDNVPELFMNYCYRKNTVYTFKNNKIISSGETYNELYISQDNNSVISYGNSGTGIGGINEYSLDDTTLIMKNIMSFNVQPSMNIKEFFLYEEEITDDEFTEKVKSYTLDRLNFSSIDDELTEGNISFFVQK